MWGTHHHCVAVCLDLRFIPTHVGNTNGWDIHCVFMAVHPHACGEHGISCSLLSCINGSSPRMWGTRRDHARRPGHRRFIPTHVGNTASSPTPHRQQSVHPHACGEHNSRIAGIFSSSGSSPRMWGTRGSRWGNRLCSWFIPTHVGNTSQGCLCTEGHTVHPHACGEHASYITIPPPTRGSSPRMWGTQQCR